MTRAMKSRDPRFSRILGKLGYDTKVEVAAPAEALQTPATPVPVVPASEADELATVRAEYSEVVGKRPFMGWDVAMLREKIAAAKAGE